MSLCALVLRLYQPEGRFPKNYEELFAACSAAMGSTEIDAKWHAYIQELLDQHLPPLTRLPLPTTLVTGELLSITGVPVALHS